jgi:NADH:ubiquinone oxidoreductase subunit E
MRYNFHEQLAAIKRNPKHVLPADINAPVKAFLQGIGCEAACDELRKLQEHVNYATIDIISAEVPTAKISVQVDAGMAEGWKEFRTVTNGKWTIHICKSIKNANLDKKKREKKEAAK